MCFRFSFKFDVHVSHLHMSCVRFSLRNTTALDNLLWESPAFKGFTSYHSFHFITHRHTQAIKHTKGQAQSSVYSTSWNTRPCVNTGMKQTEDEDWLVEAQDSHRGSGDRDRRVMMTSSRSEGSWFESCAGRSLDRQGAGQGVRGSGVMTLPLGSCG